MSLSFIFIYSLVALTLTNAGTRHTAGHILHNKNNQKYSCEQQLSEFKLYNAFKRNCKILHVI